MESVFLHLSFSQCDACVQQPFRSIPAARLAEWVVHPSQLHENQQTTWRSQNDSGLFRGAQQGSGPQMMDVMWISLFISNTHRLYVSPSQTLLLNSGWYGREIHFVGSELWRGQSVSGSAAALQGPGLETGLHHWYMTAALADAYASSVGSAHATFIQTAPPLLPLPHISLYIFPCLPGSSCLFINCA